MTRGHAARAVAACAALVVVARLALPAGPAAPRARAQDGVAGLSDASHAAALRVAERLNCPICQGYTLRDCPLEVCAQMRAEIARQLEGGATAEEVVAGFVDLYGPRVLNAPPRRGFALAAWLAPLALLALAAWAARRRLSAPPSAPAGAPAGALVVGPTAALAERVEALAREERP